ncbi:hypothetical protein SRB5_13040 [Streptomyces sp. RB5]|uniref:LPXTG cell wall anchor domain-containing protein n=1 Tax=Streptomyces smaragdinus TaxID=2585196 RepID=A0A7K0CCK4_9ACTN|nr:hypothetical protein [Streptomyces smaragdinus]MQY11190.1 hypothetical protein [Streptomyces smaragdinus]
MNRWQRVSLALAALPLLLAAAPPAQDPPDDGGSYAQDGDPKNPGGAPAGVPDFGTFTPPPQGDSDDTPALAAAALAAMSMGAAAFVLGWGRKPGARREEKPGAS